MPETVLAEELAKEFKEHSVAEFFKKNKQMLGLVGKIRTLTTIVHEYVTNSVDACEEAHILPDVEVQISELGEDYYEVAVVDNGPGLTKETVGKAFGKLLAGTKFHRMMQMRGQQGIGCAGCTMYSQITTGKPTHVITGTGKGKAFGVEILIDPKLNQSKLGNLVELNRPFHGTAVKAKFKDVKYVRSEQGPLEYLRRTAIANPHVRIKLKEPGGETIIFDRSTKEIPRRPVEVKPHPKGITVDELLSLAKETDARKTGSFLKNALDRMGDKSLVEIESKISFDINKDPKKLEWHEAEELIKAFKAIDFIAPRLDGLRPIGEERIVKSLQSIVKPEFLSVITRKPQVYSGGFPFQIEVAVAYGGDAGRVAGSGEEGIEKKVEIMRFANLAPLLFDSGGCAITKAVQTVDWKRYGIRDVENAPLTVFVNLVSVHVPYTSAGKQAIAAEPEVLEEMRLALMECGRKTARYIAGKRRLEEKQMRRELFYKYIPEVAFALGRITKENEEKLRKKLEKLVLEKLKLEEAREATEMSDEEAAEFVAKDVKEKTKGKKAKGSEDAGFGNSVGGDE